MNIIETGIPDIYEKNIDETKVDLANEIIDKIKPLFNEVHTSKESTFIEKNNSLKMKKNQVLESKKSLELLLANYNKEKIIKKLLDKISKLVESGIAYDGSIKSETVILLKILPNMKQDKINHHFNQISSSLRKRFG